MFGVTVGSTALLCKHNSVRVAAEEPAYPRAGRDVSRPRTVVGARGGAGHGIRQEGHG